MTQKQFNKAAQLIGQDLASLWDGRFLGKVEKDDAEKTLYFYCVEHGDHFVTDMSYDEFSEECDKLKAKGLLN